MASTRALSAAFIEEYLAHRKPTWDSTTQKSAFGPWIKGRIEEFEKLVTNITGLLPVSTTSTLVLPSFLQTGTNQLLDDEVKIGLRYEELIVHMGTRARQIQVENCPEENASNGFFAKSYNQVVSSFKSIFTTTNSEGALCFHAARTNLAAIYKTNYPNAYRNTIDRRRKALTNVLYQLAYAPNIEAIKDSLIKQKEELFYSLLDLQDQQAILEAANNAAKETTSEAAKTPAELKLLFPKALPQIEVFSIHYPEKITIDDLNIPRVYHEKFHVIYQSKVITSDMQRKNTLQQKLSEREMKITTSKDVAVANSETDPKKNQAFNSTGANTNQNIITSNPSTMHSQLTQQSPPPQENPNQTTEKTNQLT